MASPSTRNPNVELPEPPPEQPEDVEHQQERPRQKAVTIGAVCKALAQEFPDISISKIRYLEDQKLLAPRPTRGGRTQFARVSHLSRSRGTAAAEHPRPRAALS